MNKQSAGFTFVEVVIVMGLVGLLMAIVGQTLFRSEQSVNLDTVAQKMISDIKNQQMHAMTGDTATPGTFIDYSVRFEETQYILYPGLVYSPGNSANTVISVVAPISISSMTIPDSTISFSRLSGDVRDFATGSDTVTVRNDQTGQTKTIRINKRGAIF